MVKKIHDRRNEHLFEKCYNCPRSPLSLTLLFNLVFDQDLIYFLNF